jgi:hypothetical protein
MSLALVATPHLRARRAPIATPHLRARRALVARRALIESPLLRTRFARAQVRGLVRSVRRLAAVHRLLLAREVRASGKKKRGRTIAHPHNLPGTSSSRPTTTWRGTCPSTGLPACARSPTCSCMRSPTCSRLAAPRSCVNPPQSPTPLLHRALTQPAHCSPLPAPTHALDLRAAGRREPQRGFVLLVHVRVRARCPSQAGGVGAGREEREESGLRGPWGHAGEGSERTEHKAACGRSRTARERGRSEQ